MGAMRQAARASSSSVRPFDGPSRDGFLHGRMATGHKKRREKALPPDTTEQMERRLPACPCLARGILVISDAVFEFQYNGLAMFTETVTTKIS